MAIRITIRRRGCAAVRETRWFRRKLTAAANAMNVHAGTWAILLLDDRRMDQLHRRTMNIPGTTDVLTFDHRHSAARTAAGRPGAPRSPLALQTVVCVEEARRQAKERGHPMRHELLLYMVHSLLHVTGYDDSAPTAARRMHRKEDDILRRLGVGPVFYRRRRKSGRPNPDGHRSASGRTRAERDDRSPGRRTPTGTRKEKPEVSAPRVCEKKSRHSPSSQTDSERRL